MKKLKKILIPVAAVLMVAGVVIVLSLVNNEQKNLDCKRIEISLDTRGQGHFITEQDLLAVVKKSCDTSGTEFRNVNLSKIEADLEKIPELSNAEAFRSINGTLKIEAKQRLALARIQNLNGTGYYLDDTGEIFPLSEKYTPRVLFVNGNIDESYLHRRGFMNNDSIQVRSIIDDTYKLAKFIEGDEFWKAQIEQIHINSDREFELIPRVGNHVILFGDTTHTVAKFKKLEIFYSEGLNTDGWNDYKTVNLKFRNQIICKR